MYGFRSRLAVRNYVLPWVLFAIAAVFYLFEIFPEIMFLTEPECGRGDRGHTSR
jgi:hypothetical protein